MLRSSQPSKDGVSTPKIDELTGRSIPKFIRSVVNPKDSELINTHAYNLENLDIPLEIEIMFMPKFKTCLRFLGILSMRVLLGIVAGFLWLAFIAFISRNIVGWIVEKIAYRDLDGSYNSIAEAAQRYDSMRASAFDIVLNVGWIGVWICLAVGILWGFSQGRLDIGKWLLNFIKRNSIMKQIPGKQKTMGT